MRSNSLRRAVGIVLVACSAHSAPAAAEDDSHLPAFRVPVEFWTEQSYHPAAYLESLRIGDAGAELSPSARAALVKLFRAAHYACRFKYRQTYPLRTSTPAYALLKTQYPDLAEREGERGNIVLLEDVVGYLEGPGALLDAEEERAAEQEDEPVNPQDE